MLVSTGVKLDGALVSEISEAEGFLSSCSTEFSAERFSPLSASWKAKMLDFFFFFPAALLASCAFLSCSTQHAKASDHEERKKERKNNEPSIWVEVGMASENSADAGD
jgi:hypothetical protein